MKSKVISMMAAVLVMILGTGMKAQNNDNDGNVRKKAVTEAKAHAVSAKNHSETVKSGHAAGTKVTVDTDKHKAAVAKAKASSAKDAAQDRRGDYADKRQDNQGKRIQHGINKGYLTPDETKSLQAQQQKIATMESTFKSDGKLSKDECGQLRDALNVASANIWAEKHDTDGNQMPTYRLGKNVYAKDSFTSQMANQNMTGAEAKALTGDFRKMLELKNSLANDNLSADARAQKQTEYDTLLNKYFEVR